MGCYLDTGTVLAVCMYWSVTAQWMMVLHIRQLRAHTKVKDWGLPPLYEYRLYLCLVVPVWYVVNMKRTGTCM